MPNFKDTPVEPVIEGAQSNTTGTGVDDPKVQQLMGRAKKYETVLMNVMHSPQTRDKVIDLLKSNQDPFVVLPEAIMTINQMGVETMKKGGIDVEPGVQLIGSQFIVNDLMMLAKGAGAFEVTEDMLPSILEDTYQMYIEKGLTDRSIDPIQLQLEVEKVMDQEQLAAGLAMGHEKVPQKPSQQAIIDQRVNTEVSAARQQEKARMAKQQAVQKRDAMAQQALAQRG